MFNGKQLKNIRKINKISQETLAKAIGVTDVSVCHYEKGLRTPSLEVFINIVRYLDISADELLIR